MTSVSAMAGRRQWPTPKILRNDRRYFATALCIACLSLTGCDTARENKAGRVDSADQPNSSPVHTDNPAATENSNTHTTLDFSLPGAEKSIGDAFLERQGPGQNPVDDEPADRPLPDLFSKDHADARISVTGRPSLSREETDKPEITGGEVEININVD